MTRTKRSSSGPVKEPLASSSPPTRSITTKARQSGGGRGGNKRPMKPESPEDATRVAPTARVLPSNGSSGATHPTDLLSDFPRSYSYPPLLGTVEVGGGAGGENTQLTTQSQPPSPAMMSPPTNTRTGLSTPRRLESPIAHSLANLPLTSQANTATGGDALGSSTNHNNKPPIHPRTGPSQTTQAGQTEVTQLDSILISSALSTTHPTLHNSSTSSNTAGVSPVSRSKDATTAAAPPTRASSMGVAGKSSGTVGSSGAMKGRTPSLVRGDSSLISGDNNLTNTRDSGSDGGGTHLNSPQPPSSLNRRTSSTRRGHNNSGLDLSRSTTTTRRGVESGCTTPLSGESCTTGQQLNASVNSRSATRSSRGVRVNLAQKALIGRGSYGVVFKAMSRETNQLIAVKEIDLHRATQTSMSHSTSCTQMPNHQAPPLPSSGASNVSSVGRTDSVFQERLQRVRRELSVLRQLDHPNIVRCLGEECDGQFLRIYMEYVPGGSVTQLISTFSPLQEIQASIFAKQVLHGLAYLHARHIIHRDLKGDNLLVDTNGRLKLADFGTAKDISTIVAAANIANGSESRTSGSENGVVGTANFLAPEVVDGKLEAGPAVDIWALGCCVVEMLTGKAPLAHLGNPYRVMLYIAEHPHHLVEEYIPVGNTWSASVIDFIRRCLQTDPAKRPSAVELLKHPWITDPPSDDSIGLDTADGDLSLANASIGIMANVSDEMMADSEAASAPFQEALPPPTITITREAGTSGIGDDGTTMEREGSPSAVLISENSGSLQPRKNTSRRDRRHPRRRTRNVVGDAFTQELSHLDDIQRVRKLAAELLEESGSTQGSVEISPIGRRLIGSLAQQRQQQQQQQHGGSGGIPSPAMSPLEPITSSPRHALTLLDLPANLHRGSYQPSPTKTPVRSPFLPSLGQWGTGGLAEGGVGLLGSRQGPSPTSTSPRSQGIHDCPSSNFGFTCSESKLDGDPLNHNVCSPSDSPGSTRRPSKRRSYLLTELPPSEELMIAPKSSGLVDLGTSSHRRSDGVVASPSPSKKKGKKKKSMDS